MKKWIKIVGIVVIVVVVLVLGYSVFRGHHPVASGTTTAAYLTSHAEQGTFTGQVSATGSVEPNALAVVQSPGSATISTLSVKLNQTVASGATLATLSNGQTLTSPIAGTVISLPIAAGSYVTAGETVATVADTSILYANVQVPEQFVREVADGQTATLTLPALPGQTFSGTVTEVGQQGTAGSSGVVEYPTTIKISNPSHILVGMSVAAIITTGTVDNAVYVPTAALVTLNGQFYVLEPGSNLAKRLASSPSGFNGFSSGGLGCGSGFGGGGFAGAHHGGGLFSLFRGGGAAQFGASIASTIPVEVSVKIGLMNLSETQITSGISSGQTVLIPNPSATTGTTGGFGGGGFGGGFGGGR
jgi:HlyD family secretion protein